MNGKQCKKLRKLAMTKAHSSNETTFEGARARKLNDAEKVLAKYDNSITIVKDHFVQRVLSPFSLKSITKKMKRMFVMADHTMRCQVIPQIGRLLSDQPELFNLNNPAK
jgi:hypothetical protein